MIPNRKIYHDFLYDDVMSLQPSSETKIVDFIGHLVRLLTNFKDIYAQYKQPFASNNVKCFINDKQLELESLKRDFLHQSSDPHEPRLASFNVVFVTGGMCIGKTTIIKKLITDPDINPDGKQAHMIVEPTDYWYKNEQRQMDDLLLFFVVRGQTQEVDEFPFSEFFITTWLINIMINLVRASIDRKSLLLIERDYSDEYLLQRRPFQLFTDSFKCLESMKTNFNSFVLLRFITKGPLIQVMRKNLVHRQTSELEALDDQGYLEFIHEYEAGYKSIASLLTSSSSKVIIREFFIERFVSERLDEIKHLILRVLL